MQFKQSLISIYNKLSKSYVLTIFEPKNLIQIRQFNITIFKFILFVFLFIIVLISPILFYNLSKSNQLQNKKSNLKTIQLTQRIDQLESDLDSYKTQVDKLKQILTGNSSSIEIGTMAKNDNEKNNRNLAYKLNPPLKGFVTEKFSTVHPSVDIASKKGQKIRAVYSGSVIYKGWSKDTGNTLIIQHPNNILSVYKHCQSVFVEMGNKVKSNQEIALVGSTGELSTGYHLHFELWYNGKPLDPQKYINFK